MIQTIGNTPKIETPIYSRKNPLHENVHTGNLNPNMDRYTYRVSLCCDEILKNCQNTDLKIVAPLALIIPVAYKYKVDPKKIYHLINSKK